MRLVYAKESIQQLIVTVHSWITVTSHKLNYLFSWLTDITTVFACGLATDFCVAYTAFDSCTHGFQTFVIDDACRGVCGESIEEVKTKEKRNGIKIIESSEIDSILKNKWNLNNLLIRG